MPLDPGSPRPTSISVFGHGYVGCVSAACFAERGHSVAGVNPVKAGFLRVGRAPVAEERIGELIAEVVAAGRLTVSDDPTAAVHRTDVSLDCVGTPSARDGGLSTEHLFRASEDVGTREPAVVAATERAVDRTVIDLVRRPDAAVRRTGPRYTGVAW